MTLLGGALSAVFGAAFAPLYLDGVLHKTTLSDTGGGGFATSGSDVPVKAMVESISDQANAASGLPAGAVSISVLAAGLVAGPDLDDTITVSERSFRVIRRATDPVGAAWQLTAIPA